MNTSHVRRALTVLTATTLLAACATTPSRPTRSEFQDIPVPKGLTYVPDRSTIIESPVVKAARLVYRGRFELESLVMSMRSTLESTGWRHISSTTSSNPTTTQVYEKSGNSLQVVFWETWWYTYVEVTASRSLQATK